MSNMNGVNCSAPPPPPPPPPQHSARQGQPSTVMPHLLVSSAGQGQSQIHVHNRIVEESHIEATPGSSLIVAELPPPPYAGHVYATHTTAPPLLAYSRYSDLYAPPEDYHPCHSSAAYRRDPLHPALVYQAAPPHVHHQHQHVLDNLHHQHHMDDHYYHLADYHHQDVPDHYLYHHHAPEHHLHHPTAMDHHSLYHHTHLDHHHHHADHLHVPSLHPHSEYHPYHQGHEQGFNRSHFIDSEAEAYEQHVLRHPHHHDVLPTVHSCGHAQSPYCADDEDDDEFEAHAYDNMPFTQSSSSAYPSYYSESLIADDGSIDIEDFRSTSSASSSSATRDFFARLKIKVRTAMLALKFASSNTSEGERGEDEYNDVRTLDDGYDDPYHPEGHHCQCAHARQFDEHEMAHPLAHSYGLDLEADDLTYNPHFMQWMQDEFGEEATRCNCKGCKAVRDERRVRRSRGGRRKYRRTIPIQRRIARFRLGRLGAMASASSSASAAASVNEVEV